MTSLIEQYRKKYHRQIFDQLLSVEKGVPSFADKHSQISVAIAKGMVKRIALKTTKIKSPGQTSGKSFERLTAAFLEKTFWELHHLKAGKYELSLGKRIDDFEQYEHLALLSRALESNRQLRATLGDYIISPDIVIGRLPVEDDEINKLKKLISGENVASLTPLRAVNSNKLILHASISCKWTIRSDRSQNARTEGLNLIRNRKGHTPHIVIVTAEPYPQRIASVALGTGDIDCVYHFALRELLEVTHELKNDAIIDMLDTLVEGKRLRDISDLPFDLAG